METLMSPSAEAGYNAYGQSVQWKAYNGQKMPTWDELPDRIKEAWCKAADAVVTFWISMYVTTQKGQN